MDTALDMLSLQNLENKAGESFKEYAQRWRDLATQDNHPLQRETTMLFVNIIRTPYHEKLVKSTTKCFADLVIFSEFIKSSIKSGKIEEWENAKKEALRERKNERPKQSS